MADDFQQVVNSLKEKQQLLTARYVESEKALDSARKRIDDLEYTVRQQNQEIERLTQQVDFLTVVSTSMPDREDIEKSRAMLSGLVREIDKCINDLTD